MTVYLFVVGRFSCVSLENGFVAETSLALSNLACLGMKKVFHKTLFLGYFFVRMELKRTVDLQNRYPI